MIQDLRYVYGAAGKRTLGTIKSQPLSLLLPFGLQFLFILMAMVNYQLLAGLNILGGFIVAIINAAGLSIAYTQYQSLIEYGRFNKSNIVDQMKYYFFPIYGIYFLFMILRILTLRSSIITLILFFAINPLPEVLYMGRRHGMDAVSSSFEFVRDNILHWYIPLALMLLIILLVNGASGLRSALYMTDIVDQVKGLAVISNFSLAPGNLILIFVTGFYNLFRGHLYKILAGSSMRKRKFMGAMDL